MSIEIKKLTIQETKSIFGGGFPGGEEGGVSGPSEGLCHCCCCCEPDPGGFSDVNDTEGTCMCVCGQTP